MNKRSGVTGILRSARSLPTWARQQRSTLGSSVTRAALLPVTGIASILLTRLVVDATGLHNYAAFSVLIALPALVPLTDFGLGVSLTDTAAKFGVKSSQFASIWATTQRLVWLIAAAAAAVGAALTALRLWPAILGLDSTPESNMAALLVSISLAIMLPVSIGQRVLLGIGRQLTATLATSVAPLFSTAFVLAAILCGSRSLTILVTMYLAGPLICQACMYIYVMTLRSAAVRRRPGRQRSHTILTVFRSAWPMVIMSVALPLAYQSDRIILGHTRSLADIAAYSAAIILYLPLLSVVNMGAIALWPKFLSMTDRMQIRVEVRRMTLLFSALGLVCAVGLVVFGRWVSGLAVGRENVADIGLYLAFGVLLLSFGFHATAGMFLMDYRGRILQAVGSMLLLAAKIPLSILLSTGLGPAGAVIGTIIAMLVFMVIPARVVMIHRLRHQEAIVDD